MHKISKLITLAAFGLSSRISAQPGSLDNTFQPQTVTGTYIKACKLQTDGKIIAGGNFAKGIMRLNADGSPDPTFNAGSGADATVSSIALQQDGRILIGGDFSSYNGVASNKIARLNSDGSLDNSFITGTGFNGSGCTFNALAKVNALALQNDGKILAGGCFTVYNGTTVSNIVRLTANGSLDNSFFTGAEPNDNVFSITLQNDGKLVIGGRFVYAPDGFVRGFLARLNGNGSLDTAFSKNISIGPTNVAEVYATAIQPDGKIILAGNFNYCNGATAKRLAVLNPDGTRDNTFLLNQVSPIYYEARSLALQQDGKILVGGSASLPSPDTLNRVLRFNSNGSLDNSFVTGAGVNNGDVYSVILQNDGKIIIGGNFNAYNGTARNGVARLNGENPLGIVPLNYNAGESLIFPNPNNGIFRLQLNEDVQQATISITDMFGKKIDGSIVNTSYNTVDIDISSETNGLYSLLVYNKGKQYVHKVLLSRSK